ncbi:MAG: T9SS type A sorting domain-containing protein [Aequorivita sp.]|nr:T9SS type A sorting domain-containing protein [Aequorivita sp.]
MNKIVLFLVIVFSVSTQAQIIVNPPVANLVACDDNDDGFAWFDLTLQDEVITLGGPNLTVTYHRTLLDAENGILQSPNPYMNDQIYLDIPITDSQDPGYGTGGIWARVESSTSNEINIVPFALEVRSAPVGNTPAPLRKCDDAIADEFTIFDLTVVATEVLGSLDPLGFDLYYYENQNQAVLAGDLALTTNPDFSQAIPDPTNFLNSINPQYIYILLVSNTNGTIPPNPNSAEGCYDIIELNIIVDASPPDHGPFEMVLCDDELQGSTPTDVISTFDLTSMHNEVSNGDPGLTVEWFFSYADEAANLPIPNPTTFQNSSTPQTVIGRVENAFGCKTLVTLTLVVMPNPTPNMNPTPLEVCDDDNDGFSVFDLNSKDAEIINGQNDVEITYHETLADAQNGTPGTEIPSPYINIVPFNQVVYARVANLVPPNLLPCYTIVELELIVNELPPITQPNNLFINEGDGDGFAIFDLTVNIPVMLGGLNPSDFQVFFYETEADAQNNTNPINNSMSYENTSNPQTIFVRVENVNTGCFVVTSFEILTDELTPDADGDGIANEDEDLNNNGDLNDDDTDGDGIPNYLDSDDDGDTVQTIDETTGIGAGVAPSYIYIDTDGDTIENYLDNDDDGDGTLTIDEDYNNNGNPIDDDTNANGIPDFLDDEVFLSVNSFGFEDLSIYPNPTSENVTVQSSQLVLESAISLYDLQGKLLFSKKMLPQNGKLTINVSSLENGVYFLKISSDGNSVVKKLVKN